MGELIIEEVFINGTFMKGRYETQTYNCAHCTAIVVKHPLRHRERHWCSKCSAIICDACVGHDCSPMKKTIDETLNRMARLRTLGIEG